MASEVITSSGSYDIIPERIIAEFSYDILGRRISKQTLSSTTLYIYSGEQIIEESETINGIVKIKEYVYGNGGVDDVIAVIQDNTTYYYHKDQIGSVVGITDGSGIVVSEYRYDTFGKAYLVSGSEIGNSRLFTGREYDSEIGLYYYRARYYNAEMGRFISRDPIGMKDQINLYSYVSNNPLKFTDPTGKEKALIKVVNYFNSYGKFFQNYNKHSSSGLIGISSDYNPELNVAFGYETLLGDANIKVNNSFKNQIDNNKGYITIDGISIHLAEFGDILYGYNGAKAGFSYEHLENAAYSVTYNLKYGRGTEEERIKKSLDNENSDRILYQAGYHLAKGNQPITKEKLFSTMKYIIEARKIDKENETTGEN